MSIKRRASLTTLLAKAAGIPIPQAKAALATLQARMGCRSLRDAACVVGLAVMVRGLRKRI